VHLVVAHDGTLRCRTDDSALRPTWSFIDALQYLLTGGSRLAWPAVAEPPQSADLGPWGPPSVLARAERLLAREEEVDLALRPDRKPSPPRIEASTDSVAACAEPRTLAARYSQLPLCRHAAHEEPEGELFPVTPPQVDVPGGGGGDPEMCDCKCRCLSGGGTFTGPLDSPEVTHDPDPKDPPAVIGAVTRTTPPAEVIAPPAHEAARGLAHVAPLAVSMAVMPVVGPWDRPRAIMPLVLRHGPQSKDPHAVASSPPSPASPALHPAAGSAAGLVVPDGALRASAPPAEPPSVPRSGSYEPDERIP